MPEKVSPTWCYVSAMACLTWINVAGLCISVNLILTFTARKIVFALAYLPCCRFFVFSAKRTKVYMSYIRLSWIQMTVILTRQNRYLEFSKGIWLGGPDQIAFVKLCRTVHINHVDVLLFWRWVGTKLKKKWELVSKQSFSVPLWSDALTLEKFIPAKLYSSLSLSDRVHAIGSRSWKSLEFD